MSYLVLARKYRPGTFSEVVGQEPVLRALMNALETNRLHHAYLLSGSRGVGKTSLARLFAKAINCLNRIQAEPCGQCAPCLAVSRGQFIDLIEVDAASRTKVEDIRVLLDNVQYAPVVGQYKVYLIDEVHMLSSHSFNALLKTLEEPPPRIFFLFATTEPERLPSTVVSRCLQFHLKNLTSEQIVNHLVQVLSLEKIPYEESALKNLARASKGSLRDALGFLDQAIAYGKSRVCAKEVKDLLGQVEISDCFPLIEALVEQSATELMQTIAQLSSQGSDFLLILEALISILHNIALVQMIPGGSLSVSHPKITEFSEQLSPEEVQLFYQIALLGRRDLPLVPSAQMGFEMVMLRMLAFRPIDPLQSVAKSPLKSANSTASHVTTEGRLEEELADWVTVVNKLALTGAAQALASHSQVRQYNGSCIHLWLDPSQVALYTPKQVERLNAALVAYLRKPVTVEIYVGSADLLTPAKLKQQAQESRLRQAHQDLKKDPNIQALIHSFDAIVEQETTAIIKKED